MSAGLLGKGRIFRLPSNAELFRLPDTYIYSTKPFPRWRLCLNMASHRSDFYVLYSGEYCPLCGVTEGNRREAIRFVSACPAGHMDEVNWYLIVHGNRRDCRQMQWFKWKGRGALSEISLECPDCGSSELSLGQAYAREWNCSGRFPEREPIGTNNPIRPGCAAKARIVQRQAANLRIPYLMTLFTIPPADTRLHIILEKVIQAIVGNQPGSVQELDSMLKRLVQGGYLSENERLNVVSHGWGEIQSAIRDLRQPVPDSYTELIDDEFLALLNGSRHGIPPTGLPGRPEETMIEIDPNTVSSYHIGSTEFSVAPISKLRTVTVQKGYQREIRLKNRSVDPAIVDVSFEHPAGGGNRWYPGVEYKGEGIFVTHHNDNDSWMTRRGGANWDSWKNASQNHDIYPSFVFRDDRFVQELEPGFVWWHTLSHLLIRELSLFSGYQSASIRERVYFETKPRGEWRGGILLYTAQPGMEGTLGGLISLVPSFGRLLAQSFNKSFECSGDPLCVDSKFRTGNYNGAACYGCVLLPETSCEHRNMWLDRHVLMENSP